MYVSEMICHAVWETCEHHYALMNDPEVYPRMLEAVKECVVGPVKLYHVLLEPTSAVAVALNSPVASIDHIVELKAGVTRKGMLAELSNLFEAPPSDTPSTAFRGGCFGKVVENNELTVIRGWDSSLVSNLRAKANEQLTLNLVSTGYRTSKQSIEGKCISKKNTRTFELRA